MEMSTISSVGLWFVKKRGGSSFSNCFEGNMTTFLLKRCHFAQIELGSLLQIKGTDRWTMVSAAQVWAKKIKNWRRFFVRSLMIH